VPTRWIFQSKGVSASAGYRGRVVRFAHEPAPVDTCDFQSAGLTFYHLGDVGDVLSLVKPLPPVLLSLEIAEVDEGVNPAARVFQEAVASTRTEPFHATCSSGRHDCF